MKLGSHGKKSSRPKQLVLLGKISMESLVPKFLSRLGNPSNRIVHHISHSAGVPL